jgi:hypothetical protein
MAWCKATTVLSVPCMYVVGLFKLVIIFREDLISGQQSKTRTGKYRTQCASVPQANQTEIQDQTEAREQNQEELALTTPTSSLKNKIKHK